MMVITRRDFLGGAVVGAAAIAGVGALSSRVQRAYAAAPDTLPLAAQTDFGVDCAPSDVAGHRTTFAGTQFGPDLELRHARLFSASTPQPFGSSLYANFDAITEAPVQSFRSYTQSSFDNWVNSIPSGATEAWICYLATPEGSVSTQADVDAYVNVYAQMQNRRSALANGSKVRFVKIFDRKVQSGLPTTDLKHWSNFHANQTFVDCLGLDAFMTTAEIAGTSYPTNASMLGVGKTMSSQTGLNWAVTAYGLDLLASDTDGSLRRAQMVIHADYIRTQAGGACPALWANWWCNGTTHIHNETVTAHAWHIRIFQGQDRTWWGSNIPGGTATGMNRLVSDGFPVQVLRTFDKVGEGINYPDSARFGTNLPGNAVFVHSFQPDVTNPGALDTQFTTFCQTALDRYRDTGIPTYWTCLHEADADVRKGTYTAATYRSVFQHYLNISNGFNSNAVVPIQIFVPLAVSDPGLSVLLVPGSKVIAWDPYEFDTSEDVVAKINNTRSNTPSDRQFAIAECGVDTSNHTATQLNSKLAQTSQNLSNTATTNAVVTRPPFVCYFNNAPWSIDTIAAAESAWISGINN